MTRRLSKVRSACQRDGTVEAGRDHAAAGRCVDDVTDVTHIAMARGFVYLVAPSTDKRVEGALAETIDGFCKAADPGRFAVFLGGPARVACPGLAGRQLGRYLLRGPFVAWNSESPGDPHRVGAIVSTGS